ncbi:MAG TPA: hypothetical protein VD884_05690 [Ohtaekwangia sp.]|nr:hypothetical protein [Ohtaekwangia sp.]
MGKQEENPDKERPVNPIPPEKPTKPEKPEKPDEGDDDASTQDEGGQPSNPPKDPPG